MAGSIHYIRVDPSNGHVHTIMMVADDSASISASRRTSYAYSIDAGDTWDTFGGVRIPGRRSGFPTLDLARGNDIGGSPIIANHAEVGAVTKSIVSIDTPPGTGAFSELSTQDFSPYEPIWPYVASAADGSVLTHATPSLPAGVTQDELNYMQRTEDFSTWSTWTAFQVPNLAGGRNSTVANAGGRVGTMVHGNGSARLFESLDNGATWGVPLEIYPPEGVIVGEDTLQSFSHSDLVYDGDTPLVAVGVSRRSSTGGNYFAGTRIQFLRPGSSLVTVVPWDSVSFPRGFTWVSQSNQLPVCFPSIGLSGDRIVIVYTGYLEDTTTIDPETSRRFADVFYVQSSDGGATWTEPVNLTNTPDLDERYAGVSKWNPAGYAYIVWQEDTRAGAGSAGTPEAPVTRASQVFHKIDLTATSVGDHQAVPHALRLHQNYPNPFNPSTSISFALPQSNTVTLKVYDVLGREVATLLNERRDAGTHRVEVRTDGWSTGVYMYRLTAGEFSETRRMVLLR